MYTSLYLYKHVYTRLNHVYTMYIHGIYMQCIYHVYTMYIHVHKFTNWYIHVYTFHEKYEHVYTMYMICLYYSIVYTWFIHVYTLYIHVYTCLSGGGRIPDEGPPQTVTHPTIAC